MLAHVDAGGYMALGCIKLIRKGFSVDHLSDFKNDVSFSEISIFCFYHKCELKNL